MSTRPSDTHAPPVVSSLEDNARAARLSLEDYRHLLTLLHRYQADEKKRLYEGFTATEVVDFLLDYVYAPHGTGAPGEGLWADRFHEVYLRYHQRIDNYALFPHPALKMGYGLFFLETLWLLFRFYGLTHEMDTRMLEVLGGWLKNKRIEELTDLPDALYAEAFQVTDPTGNDRRRQVQLADQLLEKVVTVMRSGLAMGTIQAGLGLLGKVAPKNFRDIVPYAQQVIGEGQKVLKPHLKNVTELREEMLRREEAYITRML